MALLNMMMMMIIPHEMLLWSFSFLFTVECSSNKNIYEVVARVGASFIIISGEIYLYVYTRRCWCRKQTNYVVKGWRRRRRRRLYLSLLLVHLWPLFVSISSSLLPSALVCFFPLHLFSHLSSSILILYKILSTCYTYRPSLSALDD